MSGSTLSALFTRHPTARMLLSAAAAAMMFTASTFLLLVGQATAASSTLYNLMTDAVYESVGGTTVVAQQFTTGSAPATLTSVQVWLRNNVGSSGNYTVTLRTSTSNTPGGVIETLANNVSVPAYYDSQPTLTSSGTSLTANTSYFIVVSATSGMLWKGGTSTPATSVSPTPSFISMRSTDGGATFPTTLSGSFRDIILVVNETPTVPGVPTGVGAVAGDASAAVSWTAPTGNGGATITGYTATSAPGSFTCSTAVTSCSVAGLTNGTSYTFTVVATNSVGNSLASSPSSAVTPRTVPGAPVGVNASAGDASASVSWTAPASDGGSVITGYTATSAPGSFTCATASTSCTVAGLTNGTPYTFSVIASNAAGSSSASSPSSSVTPRTTPGAPTISSITDGDESLSVAFTAPGSTGGAAITDYEYSTDNGSTWKARQTGSTGSPLVITTVSGGAASLANGTTYQVKIRAKNAAGSGTASSSESGTPRTTPGAPTISSITAGDQTLSVAFTAPGSTGGAVITDYEYSTDNGSTWKARQTGSTGSPLVITTVSGGAASLANGTTYQVKIRAKNVAGSGTASSAVASAPQSPGGGGTTPTPTPTPSATPSSTASAIASPTPTATAPAPPRPAPTPGRSPRPTPTPAGEVGPTAEALTGETGATPSISVEVEEEEVFTIEVTPTRSPSPTASPEPTPTSSATAAQSDGAPPVVTFDAQPPPGVSIFDDNAPVGPVVNLEVDLQVGASIGGSAAVVEAAGLLPGSPVEILMFSEPRVIGTGIADEAGNVSVITTLPGDLPSGQHTIMALGTAPNGAPVQSVGAFELSDSGTVTSFVEPGQTTTPIEPGDKQLERALAAGKPVYDIARYPAATAAVAVAAASVVGLAGAGGLTNNSPGGSKSGEGESSSRGKLATVVTKKLKAIKAGGPGRGDLSRTWAMPGTRRTDAWIRELPKRAGKISALVPRVLVDGTWSRAMFGSFGFILWGIGLILGLASAWSTGFQALPPALPLMLAIIALGILDAAAGAIAWLTISVAALVTGNLTTWPEFRTILGLFVIFASIPLLAHVIRPLRRRIGDSWMDRFDRVADYVMPPIFLAFAASSMFKALNGLSGLELVSPEDFGEVRLVVIAAFLIRMAMEDVATYAYPVRSAEVQPEKLVSPGRNLALTSVAVRLVLFLIIAEPFFGLGWATYLSMILVGIPMVLKVYEDDLPNWVWLNKWYPRGVARFLLLLVVGIYVSFWLLGQDATDEQVRQTYNFILLPGVVSGLIELFGREGASWPENWWKRIIGFGVWLFAVLIVTGVVALT